MKKTTSRVSASQRIREWKGQGEEIDTLNRHRRMLTFTEKRIETRHSKILAACCRQHRHLLFYFGRCVSPFQNARHSSKSMCPPKKLSPFMNTSMFATYR
uniref:Uncharacterized protein n=1 Tax=Micrurus spixii TaxID=129469 RepID=A0A2D4MI86_9SAUR